MRVERRRGRLFLYRSRRVGGRTRKEYLGPVDVATAEELRRTAETERARLKAERESVHEVHQLAKGALAVGAEFDRQADDLFRIVMRLLGFDLHQRSEWRHTRGKTAMATTSELLPPSKRVPGIIKNPVSPDPKLAKILRAGARGDASIIPEALKLFKQNNYVQARLGDVAGHAEDAIVAMFAGTNVVLREAARAELRSQAKRLLKDGGDEPSATERLIAQRAAHNWHVVHCLETLMTHESEGGPAAAALDKALSRAERRLLSSLKALETLRRLRLPTVKVGQVNVGAAVQVNNARQVGGILESS